MTAASTRDRNGRRLVAALVVSAAVFGATAVLGPRLAAGTVLTVGPPGSVRAAWVEDEPVWVVAQEEGDPVVVGAVNPHRWWGVKELVGWCPSQRMFSAYYDGSRFDEVGHYIFGPAPHGLPRYSVTDLGDGRARVGGAVPSTTRSGSLWAPQVGGGGHYCFVEGGIPPAPRPGEPMAEYHEDVPATHEVVEGSLVVNADGGTFCIHLRRPEPLECADQPLDVPQVITSDEPGVHHGRFAVRRRGQDLLDVIALPGGYMEYPGSFD